VRKSGRLAGCGCLGSDQEKEVGVVGPGAPRCGGALADGVAATGRVSSKETRGDGCDLRGGEGNGLRVCDMKGVRGSWVLERKSSNRRKKVAIKLIHYSCSEPFASALVNADHAFGGDC
jgi:hypothetical protein